MIVVKIARKVPRPTGIILISFLKLVMIISLIIGLFSIVARYNIKLLKMEILKSTIIDKVVYYIFPVGAEKRGAIVLGILLCLTILMLIGMWKRKIWLWTIELFFSIILIVFILSSIFVASDFEIIGLDHKIRIIAGKISFVGLTMGFIFLLYLTKKNVREYFGIFRRRLR